MTQCCIWHFYKKLPLPELKNVVDKQVVIMKPANVDCSVLTLTFLYCVIWHTPFTEYYGERSRGKIWQRDLLFNNSKKIFNMKGGIYMSKNRTHWNKFLMNSCTLAEDSKQNIGNVCSKYKNIACKRFLFVHIKNELRLNMKFTWWGKLRRTRMGWIEGRHHTAVWCHTV